MDITIFNGSPRFMKSNSKILSDKFIEGYKSIVQEDIPVYYLAQATKRDENVKAFLEAQIILLIFPLYTDSMPGIVKLFIEDIIRLNYNKSKKIGFIVQSGFPEGVHCLNMERYLKKLSQRLHCEYIGTITKGGIEGIQMMPPFMTKKLFRRFYTLGEIFAVTHKFDEKIINKLKQPVKLSWYRRSMFRFFSFTGLTNYYWNSNLKKHDAWENRYARPYKEAAG